MVSLFEWMADYYLNPIGSIIKSAIPGDHFKTAHLTKSGEEVLKGSLFQTGETEILEWINRNPDKKIPWPLKTIYPLKEKGLLHIEDRILPAGITNPYLLKFVMPETDPDLETAIASIGPDGATQNETEFLEMIYRDRAVLLKDIRKTFPNGSYLVAKWVKRGVLKTLVLPISRNPDGISIHPPAHPHTLNEQQQVDISQHPEQPRQKNFFFLSPLRRHRQRKNRSLFSSRRTYRQFRKAGHHYGARNIPCRIS